MSLTNTRSWVCYWWFSFYICDQCGSKLSILEWKYDSSWSPRQFDRVINARYVETLYCILHMILSTAKLRVRKCRLGADRGSSELSVSYRTKERTEELDSGNIERCKWTDFSSIWDPRRSPNLWRIISKSASEYLVGCEVSEFRWWTEQ